MADRHKKTTYRNEYVKNHQAENYERISILVRKDSGIMEGLKRAVASGKYSRNAYILEAIKRMLQFDDYMPED